MNKIEKSIIELLSHKEYKVIIEKAGIFRFPSNYRFETHSHMAYEINYINTGYCIMVINGKYVPLKSGDCVVINPYTPHCFMVDIQKTCKITQLEICIHKPANIENELCFFQYEKEFYKLKNCETLVRIIETISIYNREINEDCYAATQMNLALAQFYCGISYYINESKIDEEKQKKISSENNKMDFLINHINENIEGDLDIERLANEYGVSSRYVRKYFSNKMGIKCSEYIALLRIGKAKELLCYPSYSITDVALRTGFNTSQYFSRIFKKYVGVSPIQYKNMWKE